MPDDIGVTAHGRLGSNERADRLGVGFRPSRLSPANDGVGGNGEKPRGFTVGEDQQMLEAEDTKALLGGVVRAAALGEFLPTLGRNVGRFAIEARVEGIFLDAGEANLQ